MSKAVFVLMFLSLAPVAVAAGAILEKAPIEVQVEVTEVDHTRASRFGVEWLSSVGFQEVGPKVLEVGSVERITGLRADLQFLAQEGAAELLANPNLVTDSGTEARFHAGGEIPYITSSALGTSHVEFKPYGVALKIKPVLLKNGQIRMEIRASVSAPDSANGVVLSGNAVPALLEREVASNVTVEPGTTMTLAGLVQTQKDRVESGVPILRKVPILGALFRWRRTNFRRTTIIIFVTPSVVES